MLKYASLNQSNHLSKEEIKNILLEESYLRYNPNDADERVISEDDFNRTAEQICNLTPASISKEKEISDECIGLYSKCYDDEETGIHFKQRMKFLANKYNF